MPAGAPTRSTITDAPRPAVATTASVLVVLAALLTAAELLFYGSFLGHLSRGDMPVTSVVRLSAQFVVPALAYGVLAGYLLRGAPWARTAVTTLAVVALATQAPALLVVLVAEADPMVAYFLAPLLALFVALVLLWTAPSRAWYGPLR